MDGFVIIVYCLFMAKELSIPWKQTNGELADLGLEGQQMLVTHHNGWSHHILPPLYPVLLFTRITKCLYCFAIGINGLDEAHGFYR